MECKKRIYFCLQGPRGGDRLGSSRQIDIYIQIDRQIDRQIVRWSMEERCKGTDRKIDKQIGKQIVRILIIATMYMVSLMRKKIKEKQNLRNECQKLHKEKLSSCFFSMKNKKHVYRVKQTEKYNFLKCYKKYLKLMLKTTRFISFFKIIYIIFSLYLQNLKCLN